MKRPFTIWGGVGGNNGVSAREKDEGVVREFLDRCAESGVTRFIPGYTPGRETCVRYDHARRAFDPQDVLAVLPPFYELHGWDPLDFLVEEANRRGIEVHPYNAVGYTGGAGINSQTGTTTYDMHISRFGNDHPECWMRRQDGLTSFDAIRSVVLSYGCPEARAHEQEPFVRMARDYAVGGVQLEFQIESAPRQVDAHGVTVYGYEEPIVDAYREKSGRNPFEIPNQDEDWTRFRATYMTEFVRELKATLDALDRPVKLTAAVASNPNTAYKRMQDWPVWVEEEIIDEIHLRHLTGNLAHIYEDTAAAVTCVDGRVPVVAQLNCWGSDKLITPALMKAGAATALAAGADQVGIYRADRIDERSLWGAARDIARGEIGG